MGDINLSSSLSSTNNAIESIEAGLTSIGQELTTSKVRESILQLNEQIDLKQKEIHTIVSSRYNELIESADAVVSIHQNCIKMDQLIQRLEPCAAEINSCLSDFGDSFDNPYTSENLSKLGSLTITASEEKDKEFFRPLSIKEVIRNIHEQTLHYQKGSDKAHSENVDNNIMLGLEDKIDIMYSSGFTSLFSHSIRAPSLISSKLKEGKVLDALLLFLEARSIFCTLFSDINISEMTNIISFVSRQWTCTINEGKNIIYSAQRIR